MQPESRYTSFQNLRIKYFPVLDSQGAECMEMPETNKQGQRERERLKLLLPTSFWHRCDSEHINVSAHAFFTRGYKVPEDKTSPGIK